MSHADRPSVFVDALHRGADELKLTGHGGGPRDARASEREFIRSRAATIGPRIQLAVVAFVVPAITWLVLLATASGLAGQLRDAGVLASG